MLRIALILLTSLIANLSISYVAIADIYKFVDENGLIHYTDQPKNKQYKRVIKTRTPRFFGSYTTPMPTIHRFSSANKQRFSDLIEQAAYRHQVDPKLVHAVIQTESAYNSTAISSAGAVGLMQLMPDTARRFGVYDRNDPDQNVDGGTRYLKHLIGLFEPNLDLAVAAYNAGENAVMKYNNSIPPYPETQNYVKQVLALYHR